MPRTSDRNYEAMVILNAGLSEEETEGLIGKLRDILTTGGADIRETSLWGRRRLAYEIQKKKEGYYLIFYFTLDPPGDTLEQFKKLCRYNEDILRHVFIKVPFKKKGIDVKQIVPEPGHLADYKFEPRAFRRRPPRDSRRPMEHAAPKPDSESVEPAPGTGVEQKAETAAPAADATEQGAAVEAVKPEAATAPDSNATGNDGADTVESVTAKE
jgi:small subunit ribosomal protein S6